jgi:hypothetical protein
MSRALWMLPVVLLACNATQNPVTSNGTSLFEWDYTKATRTGFAKATVGARTPKDFVVDVKPKDTPPFQLDVHVDFAPVDFEEGGKVVHHTAPVAIKASVKDNTGWKLTGSCQEGPNYQMDASLAMLQDCNIGEHRIAGTVLKSSWDIGFTLDIYGDGTIKPFPADDVTITPK